MKSFAICFSIIIELIKVECLGNIVVIQLHAPIEWLGNNTLGTCYNPWFILKSCDLDSSDHRLLPLSAKQKAQLNRWARPDEIMPQPTMIYAVSPLAIKQVFN